MPPTDKELDDLLTDDWVDYSIQPLATLLAHATDIRCLANRAFILGQPNVQTTRPSSLSVPSWWVFGRLRLTRLPQVNTVISQHRDRARLLRTGLARRIHHTLGKEIAILVASFLCPQATIRGAKGL
jgi:hypothetical protein